MNKSIFLMVFFSAMDGQALLKEDIKAVSKLSFI